MSRTRSFSAHIQLAQFEEEAVPPARFLIRGWLFCELLADVGAADGVLIETKCDLLAVLGLP